jgi:hypothetical protein
LVNTVPDSLVIAFSAMIGAYFGAMHSVDKKVSIRVNRVKMMHTCKTTFLSRMAYSRPTRVNALKILMAC